MANKKGSGILLVMAEMPAEIEEEFNQWYNEEHIKEILSYPGFLNAARYVAVSGGPKYVACYEMESVDALESAEWLQHQKTPTEWSKKINLGRSATWIVGRLYRQIFPVEVTPSVAQSDMAPVLQIGRMAVPAQDEDRFNEFYNTVYAPNYEKVPGCIRFRRYQMVTDSAGLAASLPDENQYSVVYELEHDKVSQTPEWEAARVESGGPLGDTFPRMKHARGSPGIYRKIFQLES